MLSTYEGYRSLPLSLTFEEMAGLHRQMAEEACRDGEALGLYRDLLTAAADYSKSRAGWPLWDREEKLAEDPARTSRHDKVIIALNTLARYLRMQGKAASWRDALGDAEDPYCRKRIGDFACYLVFVESLNAR